MFRQRVRERSCRWVFDPPIGLLRIPHLAVELLELENVVLLPHMGSATLEGRIDMGEKVIINIKTFADGHRPPDLVVPGML